MHALVFAAGRDSRLRPYTDATPKPLLEIDGEPLLERTLGTVVDAGDEAITIVVGYRAEAVREAIGDEFDGVPVRYAEQAERLGLAHAVRTAFEDGYGVTDPTDLPERDRETGTEANSGTDVDGRPATVVTVNGDNAFDPGCDLSRLVDRHRAPDVDGTLLLDRVARNEAEATARCALDDDGTVRSLESSVDDSASDSEGEESEPSYIAAGVQTRDARPLYAACRTVDRADSDSDEYELTDALESLVADGRRYVGVALEGWHLNANTPADLERARRQFSDRPS